MKGNGLHVLRAHNSRRDLNKLQRTLRVVGLATIYGCDFWSDLAIVGVIFGQIGNLRQFTNQVHSCQPVPGS